METAADSNHEEPSSKKLKQSQPHKTPKYKRRKIALFFSYCGAGYQGMQKNIGAKTIEADLELALYLSGAIPEQDKDHPKRFDWSRSARTDKGVSAVCQVVSGSFYVDPPGLVDRLNQRLCSQFRVFGFKRVTPSFSAQRFCDRRRYVYLLPVFALGGNCGVAVGSGILSNNVSVFTVGSGILSNNESVLTVGSGILSNNKNVLTVGSSILSNDVSVMSNGSNVDDNAVLKLVEEGNVEGECGVERFSYCGEVKERFNRILKCYEGTHNFHNFTTRIKAEDPSSQRFIVSFCANETVIVDDIEFVKCEVVGQSFMLHQIRKLIGFAVLVMRNIAPESLIEIALRKDINITVPTAPEVGLYLDECFFTSYNKKWKEIHGELSMKDYEREAEEFKIKHIYSHIASTEHKEKVVGLWLQSLNHENYRELSAVASCRTANLENSEVQITNNDDSSELEIAANLKSPEVEVTADRMMLKSSTAEVEVVLE